MELEFLKLQTSLGFAYGWKKDFFDKSLEDAYTGEAVGRTIEVYAPSTLPGGWMKIALNQGLTAQKREGAGENDAGHPYRIVYEGPQTWGMEVGAAATVSLFPHLVGLYTEKVVDYVGGICYEGPDRYKFLAAAFVGVSVPIVAGGLMNPAMLAPMSLMLVKVVVMLWNDVKPAPGLEGLCSSRAVEYHGITNMLQDYINLYSDLKESTYGEGLPLLTAESRKFYEILMTSIFCLDLDRATGRGERPRQRTSGASS